jgi:hypothetical protein
LEAAVKHVGLESSKQVISISHSLNYYELANYLIEIPHSENTYDCKQVIKLFVESGSHLLANAQWGCKSGVHKSWFISDFESKEQAMQVVPPFLRHSANIIELTTFSKEDITQFDQGK